MSSVKDATVWCFTEAIFSEVTEILANVWLRKDASVRVTKFGDFHSCRSMVHLCARYGRSTNRLARSTSHQFGHKVCISTCLVQTCSTEQPNLQCSKRCRPNWRGLLNQLTNQIAYRDAKKRCKQKLARLCKRDQSGCSVLPRVQRQRAASLVPERVRQKERLTELATEIERASLEPAAAETHGKQFTGTGEHPESVKEKITFVFLVGLVLGHWHSGSEENSRRSKQCVESPRCVKHFGSFGRFEAVGATRMTEKR